MKASRLAVALLVLFVTSASAHTPYLLPSSFAPQAGDTIALDASFSETFFVPEAAFDGSTFEVIGPDGTSVAPDKVQTFKVRTVAEHTLPKTPGTYRFSTGPRGGARFLTWELNDKRESSREPNASVPAGATVVSDFQSLTRAETYVTIGEPTRGALAPSGKGLEFVPVNHPDDLFVGEHFRFLVQYDGKPLANQPVEITEGVWTSDRKPQVIAVNTDAKGQASVELKQAGTWLALSRHRTKAPAGSKAAEISNSTTLTFRVLAP